MAGYASHDFTVDDARTFFADMKFHDVRAEMRARRYKAASARQLKQARLALLWRNYRNIPFGELDGVGSADAGERESPRVLLANHIQNAHLLTRKASLCRCLNSAARDPKGKYLRGRFPRTFVVTATPGSPAETVDAGGARSDGCVTMTGPDDRAVDIDQEGLETVRREFLISGARCLVALCGGSTVGAEAQPVQMAAAVAAARRLLAAIGGVKSSLSSSSSGSFSLADDDDLTLLATVFHDRTVGEVAAEWGFPKNRRAAGHTATGSGMDNVWIVKPSTLSRGRGITVVATLSALYDAVCRCATPKPGTRTKVSSSTGVNRPSAARCEVVVQKYIERPLLLPMRVRTRAPDSPQRRRLSAAHLCKFDIRVWVLVTSHAAAARTETGESHARSDGLSVRVFDPPYLRLCSRPYDTFHAAQNLADPLMQLTNNSVQGKRPSSQRRVKRAGGFAAFDAAAAGAAAEDVIEANEEDIDPELMWTAARFARYVRDGICEGVQQEAWDESIYQEREKAAKMGAKEACGLWETRAFPQIKRLCAAAVRSVRDRLVLRKGVPNAKASAVTGFEWLGLDFMLDADLNAMLIEANLDPDMSHSTPVTKHFVPQAVRSALDIVLPRSEQDGEKESPPRGDDPRNPQGEWVVVATM